jgi:hypothetical protein
MVDLDALLAEDAAVRVAFQKRPIKADLLTVQVCCILLLGHAQLVAGILLAALAVCVADRVIEGMV